jgi:GrpB protein
MIVKGSDISVAWRWFDRAPPRKPRQGGRGARFALLFRDYLRADETARQAWGAFKKRLAISAPDLADYGRIKSPATEVLIRAAEIWAAQTGWTVS